MDVDLMSTSQICQYDKVLSRWYITDADSIAFCTKNTFMAFNDYYHTSQKFVEAFDFRFITQIDVFVQQHTYLQYNNKYKYNQCKSIPMIR